MGTIYSTALLLCYKTIILITIQVLTGGHNIQQSFASRPRDNNTYNYTSTHRWARYSFYLQTSLPKNYFKIPLFIAPPLLTNDHPSYPFRHLAFKKKSMFLFVS